ncbi:putative alginate O-acetyltransferase [Oscillibacter valericigenes Sjm18-20]|nr:putative alginate O-acetyltransferase [Oscillibacter valericigenes Sjm18-20]
MVFSSVNFLFAFLPALLVCYFAVPRRCRAIRNGVLLIFSLAFYACGGPKLLGLMLASIVVNYCGGRLSAPGKKCRKTCMVLTVVVNLGLLGYYKYANFFMENLFLLGLPVAIPNITLPIGVSFFTFQGMSYALDVYRGNAEAEKNPFRVALYIALFPQLVAGPIVRYTTVAGEIADRRESLSESGSGAVRFCQGLAKKMLLANALGQIADAAFGAGTLLTTSMAWLGAMAYTGQIYFDFSGYSDMAIGLGRVFGFHFLENFNYPYVSRSATEFWRRWHISLSTWFRDYVYIPLGGNRCGRRRQVRNILTVWLLTGMWHGAAWNFILWGLYYGLLLLGEKFLWGGILEKAPGVLRHLYALLLIVLGWTLFRSESLAGVGAMVAALFGSAPAGLWSGETLYYLSEFRWELLLAIPASLPVGVWVRGALERRERGGSRPASAALILGPRVLALGLFGLSVLSLLGSSFNPFIYFRF